MKQRSALFIEYNTLVRFYNISDAPQYVFKDDEYHKFTETELGQRQRRIFHRRTHEIAPAGR